MKRTTALIAVSTLSFVHAATVVEQAAVVKSALIASVVIAAQPQVLNPPYLSEMPSVDRVMSAMRVADPRETALRQMGAFYQLIEIIKTLSGPREFRGFTPDEGRIIGAYDVAQYNVAQAADKSFPGPAGTSNKFSQQTPYRYGPHEAKIYGTESANSKTLQQLDSPASAKRVERADSRGYSASCARRSKRMALLLGQRLE